MVRHQAIRSEIALRPNELWLPAESIHEQQGTKKISLICRHTSSCNIHSNVMVIGRGLSLSLSLSSKQSPVKQQLLPYPQSLFTTSSSTTSYVYPSVMYYYSEPSQELLTTWRGNRNAEEKFYMIHECAHSHIPQCSGALKLWWTPLRQLKSISTRVWCLCSSRVLTDKMVDSNMVGTVL